MFGEHLSLQTDASRQRLASCLASNHRWRQQATFLRDHSLRPHLTPETVMALQCAADAADRQADWWLNAAINDD